MTLRKGVNLIVRRADQGFAHLEAEIIIGDLTQMIWSPAYPVDDQMNESEQEALNYLCAVLLALALPVNEITTARLDWLNERGNGYPLRELLQVKGA